MGGSESTFAGEQEVQLLDGAKLPYELLGRPQDMPLVWGHGLGPTAPRAMSRRTCESFRLVEAALAASPPPAGGGGGRGAAAGGAAAGGGAQASISVVLYDARGHGDSTGWEDFAGCPVRGVRQFHWRCLAFDMLAVASAHQERLRQADVKTAAPGAVIGGYSMGASTALWAAYTCPSAVRGLVLTCVTTAWEIRRSRRENLLRYATAFEGAKDPASASVVRGAAFADLPTEDELREVALPMPALLMCARDDATHPAAVVERLGKVLPRSQVVIYDTSEELHQKFPSVLRTWLSENFGA